MKSFGFTLIELLWSLAIASMLSSVGIAAFFTYSRTQALNSAVSDFTTMLQVAKSRAQTQVKDCPTGVLERYNVVLSKTADEYNIYELQGVCSGNTQPIQNQQKKLPKGIKFCIDDPANVTFSFGVLTGGASGLGSVVISGFGKTKTVTVKSGTGVIQDGIITDGACVVPAS